MPKTVPSRPLVDGSVYAIAVAENAFGLRYAAIRVLAANRDLPSLRWVREPTHLIALTSYLGAELPASDDPSLLQALGSVRFASGGRASIAFWCGQLDDRAVFIATLPPDETERAYPLQLGEFSYRGRIDVNALAAERLYEWRWEHDRIAFESEQARVTEQARQRRATRVHEPKNPMADDEFWSLIARFDWDKTGDDDAVLEPVVRALAARPVADIKAFEETLAHKLYLLDTRAHAASIGEYAWKSDDDPGFSVDTFLYARCAAVASGREVYERALANPSLMPRDIEFESLLYVAGGAYEKRTRREFEYDAGCDYETYSNRKGWE